MDIISTDIHGYKQTTRVLRPPRPLLTLNPCLPRFVELALLVLSMMCDVAAAHKLFRASPRAAPRPCHAALHRAGRPRRAVHTPRCTLRLARAAPSVAPSVAPRPRLASPAPRPLPLRARAVPHPRRAAPHCAGSPDALSRAQWPRLASAPSSLAAAPYARLLGRPQRLRRCRTGWGTQRRVGVLGGAVEASAFA